MFCKELFRVGLALGAATVAVSLGFGCAKVNSAGTGGSTGGSGGTRGTGATNGGAGTIGRNDAGTITGDASRAVEERMYSTCRRSRQFMLVDKSGSVQVRTTGGAMDANVGMPIAPN